MKADQVAGPDGSALSEGLGPRCRSETGDVMLCANAACGWMGRCVAAEPMGPGEERDCQHGQLARACERCADAREIAELRAGMEAIAAWAAATPGLTVVELGKVLALIGRRAEDTLGRAAQH